MKKTTYLVSLLLLALLWSCDDTTNNGEINTLQVDPSTSNNPSGNVSQQPDNNNNNDTENRDFPNSNNNGGTTVYQKTTSSSHSHTSSSHSQSSSTTTITKHGNGGGNGGNSFSDPNSNTNIGLPNTKFSYSGVIQLPSHINRLEDITFSNFNLYLRQGATVFIANKREPSNIEGMFELSDENGQSLRPPLHTIKSIRYNTDARLLFALTDKGVYYYDNKGNYEGKVQLPDANAEPFDIAFDEHDGEIYISTTTSNSASIYSWEKASRRPELVWQNNNMQPEKLLLYSSDSPFDRDVSAIGSNQNIFRTFKRNNNWSQSMTYSIESNGILSNIAIRRLCAYQNQLLVIGQFGNNQDMTIRYYEKQPFDKDRYTYIAELRMPNEIKQLDNANKVTIQAVGFRDFTAAYVVANGQLLEYDISL